ncbi:MAG: hypothetical protein MI754_16620 [Chromatiales bacterium]|nr:hypothetical protein [Chromatiales bacterium]
MGKVCRKCGYERQETDIAPDYECPQCGVVYAKFKPQKAENNSQPAVEAKARPQQQPKPKKKRVEPVKQETSSNVKKKSLPLAIGLNFLLPGLGYLYMGKWFAGIVGGLLVLMILLTSGLLFFTMTWLVLNIVMGIDMLILSKKNERQYVEATMMPCPACAEMIKREAKLCRFCQTKL